MTDFTSFTPYSVDLDFYKDVRSDFSTAEWIDVLLGAMDYNPNGYKDEHEKLAMLQRLLPFVEKNLNIIELAPKGTGKSYVLGISVNMGCWLMVALFQDQRCFMTKLVERLAL